MSPKPLWGPLFLPNDLCITELNFGLKSSFYRDAKAVEGGGFGRGGLGSLEGIRCILSVGSDCLPKHLVFSEWMTSFKSSTVTLPTDLFGITERPTQIKN